MVRRERWEEIRRLALQDRVPIDEIARRLDLDRKTVRRCLHDTEWQPYRRPARPDTLLAPHAAYLQERAPRVGYSAKSCTRNCASAAIGAATTRQAVRPTVAGRA